MRRGFGVLVRVAMAIVLAMGVLVVSWRGAPAVLARSPDCPSPPITFAKIVRVMEAGDQLICFGGRLLTFRAYVPEPTQGWGGTTAFAIAPAWLEAMNYRWVLLAAGSAMRRGYPTAPSMGVFVPPDLGRCDVSSVLATCPFRWYYGRWVTVSAHFDGPVAQTCRYPSHPRANRDAVEVCRRSLIVLSVGTVALPDTATAQLAHEDRDDPAMALPLGATFVLVSLLLTWRTRSRPVGHSERRAAPAGGADSERETRPG
jgi:hypothetical protein